ncbi:MAG: CsgG/HfaB family protein [Spirochaetota bacterium]|nr:CsgG/HfaB family protein [Spirochaetota bacterium]
MKPGCFTRVFLLGFSRGGILWLFILLLIINCAGPRMYVQPDADFTYIKKVAVLPFDNLTGDKFAGDKVRDLVTTDILSRGIFDVIEEGEVHRVLKEEGKASATAIDQEAGKRIGKRLGIQSFILGSVEEYGISQGGGRAFSQVAISMRMIDAGTSKILWQASYDKEGGGALSRLFGIGSKTISEISRDLIEEILDTLFED